MLEAFNLTDHTEEQEELNEIPRYIPLKQNTKDTPLIKWGTIENRFSSRKELQASYPNTNIARLTGEGILVLDVDNKKGKNGTASLQAIPGFREEDLDTYTVETPNNGRHYYFRIKEALGSRENLLEGIDIRAGGGYAVIPPSTINGKPYRVIKGEEFKPVPSWLLSLLKTEKPSTERRQLPKSSKATTPLDRLLKPIDPDLPREDWRNVIWSAIEAYGDSSETIEALDRWSQQSREGKYDKEAFNKVVDSYSEDKAEGDPVRRIKVVQANHLCLENCLPPIPLEQIEYAERLAENTAKDTVELLKSYRNDPTEEHVQALKIVAKCLVYNGLTENKSRLAIPLYTGGGKTLSIVAYLAQLHKENSDLGVWIAAGTIDQLEEFRETLIRCGIPEEKIGVKHGKSTEVNHENAKEYQFVLVTHQRIKKCDIDYLRTYKDKPRQLIWDEALVATRGLALSLKSLLDSIASWKNTYTLAEKGLDERALTPLHEVTKEYLEQIEQAITDAKIGDCIKIPDKDFSLARDLHKESSELEELDKIPGGSSAKLIQDQNSKSIVLSFLVEVPDHLEKIVILDASTPIRELTQYDKSIEELPLNVTKDYSKVTLHVCRSYVGRHTVDNPAKNTDLYQEVAHILNELVPEGEEAVVFALPDRKGVENPEQRLKHFLNIGPRNNTRVVSWGKAKGINSLSHIKHGTHIGISYRDSNELAASIAGQNRDLSYEVTGSELDKVQISEHTDQIYQAISRLACRQTVSGCAEKTDFWLFYPSDRVITSLQKLMPGIRIVEYTPQKMKPIAASSSVVAEKIIRYLEAQEVKRPISMSALRKELGIGIPTHSRPWQKIKELLNEQLPSIGYRLSDRSLVPLALI